MYRTTTSRPSTITPAVIEPLQVIACLLITEALAVAPTLGDHASIDERSRYNAWWRSGPGAPCEQCKQGDSSEARIILEQGRSFFPARVFGPDRTDRTVRYLMVAMEPAEGWIEAFEDKGNDFRDWVNLAGAKPGADATVQFGAREWLCDAGESFLMTDIAKCPAANASKTQSYRWKSCDPILKDEASLFPALRAVIAVGKDVRTGLRERPWLAGLPLFRVLHWSKANIAHHKKIYARLTKEQRGVSPSTATRFRAFINERRLLTGKEPQRAVEVNDRTEMLLAVYRQQFSCIKRALLDPQYQCGRRPNGTCCRAVPAP